MDKLKFLNVGDQAPDFTANDQDGNPVTLGDLKGQKVVVYFYPKDDTPGCTKEACSIRDNYTSFTEKGVKVIGVSPDKAARHKKFIDKYNLPFTLVEDPEQKILKSYGVWGEKKFLGKTYDGVHRTTFIIDEEGRISDIIEKVKTATHGEQLLELL